MEREFVAELETKLLYWLNQGYQIFADDVDGQLRLTVFFVSADALAKEREQEYWPMAPEIVGMLEDNGIPINRGLAGPRPWPGAHPDDMPTDLMDE